MNNKLIDNNKEIIALSIIFWLKKKVEIFFDFRSDPDPLFPDPDPRIRIHIIMIRIRNTFDPIR